MLLMDSKTARMLYNNRMAQLINVKDATNDSILNMISKYIPPMEVAKLEQKMEELKMEDEGEEIDFGDEVEEDEEDEEEE